MKNHFIRIKIGGTLLRKINIEKNFTVGLAFLSPDRFGPTSTGFSYR